MWEWLAFWFCLRSRKWGSFYRTHPPKKKGVRYPPISKPLIYYGFDLVRWCNFKDFWLPVKQVLYINKKLNHSHALFQPLLLFSLSPLSRCFSTSLLRLLVAASLNKTLKSLKPHLRCNPQTLRVRRTHKPSESGAHTTSNRRRFFSSNPLVGAAPLFYSILNRWRTHNLKSEALHLFPDDSAALLLFHSKSVAPPTIFRFSLYIWLTLIWVYNISLKFVGLWYYCFVWVSVLIYLTN